MTRALLLALALAGCQQAPPTGKDGGSIAGGSADRTIPPGPLARYVGKAPDEPVEGRSFVAEPLVREAVARTVGDAQVAALVLGAGTRTPIAVRDGQLVAAGCAPNDCAGSNWALLIRPDGRAPQVCVKATGAAPRWYGAAPVGAAKDSCPRGD